MNNRGLTVALFAVVLTVALVVFVAPRLILGLACDREADRKVLDVQPDFYCPTESQVVYDAWSECGLMKVCIDPRTGVKTGSQFAAQGGQLRSKALYSMGKEVDGSTVYDNDGEPLRENGGYKPPN